MSIEKRSLYGTLAGIVAFGFNLAQTILIVPILIGAWGKEKYGIWLALLAIFALIQTIDKGHQDYLGNELTRLYVLDKKKLKVTLASGIWMATVLGLIQIVIVLVIYKTSFLPQLLGINSLATIEKFKLNECLLILVSSWVLYGSIGGILHRIHPMIGKYVVAVRWGIIVQFSYISILACTAMLGGSILLACLFTSLGTIFINIFIYYDIYTRLPSIFPLWTEGNWKVAFQNFSRSIVLTSTNILSQLQASGLTLVISAILGASVIPIFSTQRTLSNTFISATGIVISPLAPEIIRYHSLGESRKLVGTITATWFVSGILINFGLLFTLPVIESIYSTWTRGKIPFDWKLYLLLLLSVSVKNYGSPLIYYLIGINNLLAQTIITFTQSAIVLGGSLLFLHQFGLQGAAWAVLLGELLGSIILPTYFVKSELRCLNNTSFPYRQCSLAITAPIILALVFIGVNHFAFHSILLVLIGVVSLSIAYYFQWQLLDLEVKKRLYNLLPFKMP